MQLLGVAFSSEWPFSGGTWRLEKVAAPFPGWLANCQSSSWELKCEGETCLCFWLRRQLGSGVQPTGEAPPAWPLGAPLAL